MQIHTLKRIEPETGRGKAAGDASPTAAAAEAAAADDKQGGSPCAGAGASPRAAGAAAASDRLSSLLSGLDAPSRTTRIGARTSFPPARLGMFAAAPFVVSARSARGCGRIG